MTLINIYFTIIFLLQHTNGLLDTVPGLYLGITLTIQKKQHSAHIRAHPMALHQSGLALHMSGTPLYQEYLDTL
jgi:hypothetical protein